MEAVEITLEDWVTEEQRFEAEPYEERDLTGFTI
jgi:hypothetical protein